MAAARADPAHQLHSLVDDFHMPPASLCLPCARLPCPLVPAGLGQHWGRVLSVLKDMQAAGVPWDAFTCSALLSACQASGRWEQALAWFRAAQDMPGGWRGGEEAHRAVEQCAGSRWQACCS